MAITAVRNSEGRVGTIDGRVADRGCPGCCGGVACATVWKATPCFAGQCNGEVCGCQACFPTEPIYVCTEARCLCDGPPIETTILAEYRHTPGVKWCFTVDKMTVYDVLDVPAEATIVGVEPFCVDCITGCSSSFCPAARGRFIRPKNCLTAQQAHCPWVCAHDVTAGDCRVNSMHWFDHGVAQSGCCHFIDGPVEEHYFDVCPDPWDDWSQYCIDGNCPRSCCGCVAGCGGTQTIEEVGADCPAYKICTEVNPSPSECCCGDCPGSSVTFLAHYKLEALDVTEWTSSGTCPCDGTGTYTVTNCRNGDCDTEERPCSALYTCAGGIDAPLARIGIGCYGYCNSPDYLSNVTSGAASASCDRIDVDVTSTIFYTPFAGGGSRIERVNGFAQWNRQIGNDCSPKCADARLWRPGRGRVRVVGGPEGVRALNAVRMGRRELAGVRSGVGVVGGKVISVGAGMGRSGGGGCSGCGKAGGGVMTPTLAELRRVAATRTDRKR